MMWYEITVAIIFWEIVKYIGGAFINWWDNLGIVVEFQDKRSKIK